MEANDSKSYLSYLNTLVDQYNNNYYHSINKKSINADYSALTEKTGTNSKALKFKLHDKVRINRYTNIFNKDCNKNWARETFTIDFVLQTNPWTRLSSNYAIKQEFDHADKQHLAKKN